MNYLVIFDLTRITIVHVCTANSIYGPAVQINTMTLLSIEIIFLTSEYIVKNALSKLLHQSAPTCIYMTYSPECTIKHRSKMVRKLRG